MSAMCLELIDKVNELLSQVEEHQENKSYDEAIKILNDSVNPLLKKIEALTPEENAPYEQELVKLYDRLLEDMSEVSKTHDEVRGELTDMRRKNAGVNAYLNTSRRRFY